MRFIIKGLDVRHILAGLFCFVVFLLAIPSRTIDESGTLQIHFLDVGYGDAIVIRFPDSTAMLIDGGEALYAKRIERYLQSLNLAKIDAVLLTHPHKNHFGALPRILTQYPIQQFYTNGDNDRADEGYAALIRQLTAQKIPVRVLRQGDRIQLGGDEIRLDILHPADLNDSVNGSALVTWLRYKDTAFLFTSDIGESQQDALVQRFPQIRQSQYIQFPHHGKALSDVFVGHFKKGTFIASTGPNRYGLPSLEDLNKVNGRFYRTDQHGSIILVSDGQRVTVQHD